MKIATKLWIGLAMLIVLSPLGFIVPNYFKAGPAWGEWKKASNLWNAPIPDYVFKGWEMKSMAHLSLAYIISAAIGIGITVLLVVSIGRVLAKKGD